MEIPIFKKSSPVDPGIEAPKSVNEITQQLADKYTTTGNPAEPARKRRSDLGKLRSSKNLGPSPTQDAAVASAQNGQAIAYTIDKQIVEKTASTVLHTIDGVLVRKVGGTVIKLGGTLEDAKEMSAAAGLTQGECSLMAELTGVIFEKHGLLTGYAPEILLGVLLTEWGFRVTITINKLNKMVEDNEKKRKERTAPIAEG